MVDNAATSGAVNSLVSESRPVAQWRADLMEIALTGGARQSQIPEIQSPLLGRTGGAGCRRDG